MAPKWARGGGSRQIELFTGPSRSFARLVALLRSTCGLGSLFCCSSAPLGTNLGRHWGHFRPSCFFCLGPLDPVGTLFHCSWFVLACRFSTFRCSPCNVRFSVRRCFFLFVCFYRCSPSCPRIRTVSHEHSRADFLFIDVRLWLFDSQTYTLSLFDMSILARGPALRTTRCAIK